MPQFFGEKQQMVSQNNNQMLNSLPAIEEIYPAAYSEESFRSAVRAFLSSSPNVPDGLYESLLTRDFSLNYWPFYRHTIYWTANWTADVAYEDNQQNNAPLWQPASSQANGCTVVYSPGSNTLCTSGLAAEGCRLAKAIEENPYKFTPDMLNTVEYLELNMDSDSGFNDYVKPTLNSYIEDDCIDQLPGDYQKNLRINSVINQCDVTVQMIPYWLFVYDYNGETYYVMQNAVTGAVAGDLPNSSRRKLISWALTGSAALLSVLSVMAIKSWRGGYDAVLLGALCFPTLCAGFIYQDVIAKYKARIKTAPPSEAWGLWQKLKNFESNFIKFAGLTVLGWCFLSILLTLLISAALPIWRDPMPLEPPQMPVRESRQTEVQKEKSDTVIKLKSRTAPNLVKEIEAEDGTVYVIEQ